MNFGIIIPVYNCEKYIDKTIESVLNQTYNKFKIYIIDDCSQDNSWKNIQKYNNNNKIIILRNEENMGKYKSINKVLKELDTEYFLILDGHDLLYPNILELENNILQENPEMLCIQSPGFSSIENCMTDYSDLKNRHQNAINILNS
jgi:glycosyltransferase involved in cell wall biosynthesis